MQRNTKEIEVTKKPNSIKPLSGGHQTREGVSPPVRHIVRHTPYVKPGVRDGRR